MTFESQLYDRGYFEGLHRTHWFTNPRRKYEERNRDTLRVVAPKPADRILELGSARGDVTFLLAAHAREVVGVDASGDALALAEAGRARRGLSNVRFL
ncbi:MAG TPA: methyltransferase domain-containing protein, partial [Thermoanaerobaculia bacterium]|nr:methyltransferase domain-containing protein [Thermoanaerobaculia bacterium]